MSAAGARLANPHRWRLLLYLQPAINTYMEFFLHPTQKHISCTLACLKRRTWLVDAVWRTLCGANYYKVKK